MFRYIVLKCVTFELSEINVVFYLIWFYDSIYILLILFVSYSTQILHMVYHLITVWSCIVRNWALRCNIFALRSITSPSIGVSFMEITMFHTKTTIFTGMDFSHFLMLLICARIDGIRMHSATVICLLNNGRESTLESQIILEWIRFLWAIVSRHMW